MAQQKKKIKINKKYTPMQRLAIAEDIVDLIVHRTRQGKDIQGNKWTGKAGKYSKAYTDSKDFAIAGKSKNKITLDLSSDMLDSLEVLSHKSGEITVGFKAGTPENDKAEGNIKGTYGQKTPITGKARNFLGISTKDKTKITKKYPVTPKLKKDIEKIVDKEKARVLTEKAMEELRLETEYIESYPILNKKKKVLYSRALK